MQLAMLTLRFLNGFSRSFHNFLKNNQPDKGADPHARSNFNYYGSNTLSITWMTPLLVMMSALTTLASLILTPSQVLILTYLPASVSAFFSFITFLAVTLPATTWYLRISTSLSLFSGFSKLATVPSGSAANASSVGAKTVNGPSPFRASTSPAAFTAATRVLKSSAATAVSTTS